MFDSIRKAHCIGIKGQGMTALAQIFVSRGIAVTGSDIAEVFTTDATLKETGISVKEEFRGENIPADADLIVYSTAYKKDVNPEIVAAFASGKNVLSYPEAVGLLTKELYTVAVCGTHGKTTTTALLASTLRSLGKDPLALIGSAIPSFGGNALFGQGDYFVLEADEYQDKLALYHPTAVILTSADWDHPDFFPDRESYLQTFERFVARIPRHGVLVYCSDSADVVRIAKSASCTTISYGAIEGAEYRVKDFSPVRDDSPTKQRCVIERVDGTEATLELRLAGKHNALNATAVVALLEHLKMNPDAILAGLAEFSGVGRRFERVGERFGTLLYDDFAHHPEEIRVTLKAFRELFPDKTLRVIFHPHTFTRTKALLPEFAQCFEDADEVFLLDIYGSAREEQGGVHATDLEAAINRFTPGKAHYTPDTEELTAALLRDMGKNDVIITMGAGDVWKIAQTLAGK